MWVWGGGQGESTSASLRFLFKYRALICVLFWSRIFHIPGWSQIHYVSKNDLGLLILLPRHPGITGLWHHAQFIRYRRFVCARQMLYQLWVITSPEHMYFQSLINLLHRESNKCCLELRMEPNIESHASHFGCDYSVVETPGFLLPQPLVSWELVSAARNWDETDADSGVPAKDSMTSHQRIPRTPVYVAAKTVLAIFKAVWSVWSSEEDLLMVQAPSPSTYRQP